MAGPEDIAHQQRLLVIHRRNLKVLLMQAASFGGERAAPLHMINAIQETRDSISRIKAILRGWQVKVADDVDDEVSAEAGAS
jgi:hypothetical protein